MKSTGKPNFLEARVPVDSQLKVGEWEHHLASYLDKQLLEIIRFGFLLDFNRSCELGEYTGNHASAREYPADNEAYINEELSLGSLWVHLMFIPYQRGMTRNTPNSDRRWVIVDFNWPHGASINMGIDKTSYLNSEFFLQFPRVDDTTSELKSALVQSGRESRISSRQG